MSQTPDIVERLRETDWGPNVADTLTNWDNCRREAADTIEALRAQLAAVPAIVEASLEEFWAQDSITLGENVLPDTMEIFRRRLAAKMGEV